MNILQICLTFFLKIICTANLVLLNTRISDKWFVCVYSACTLLSYACMALVKTTVHQVFLCILSQIGFLL